jgi:hypothetical protein
LDNVAAKVVISKVGFSSTSLGMTGIALELIIISLNNLNSQGGTTNHQKFGPVGLPTNRAGFNRTIFHSTKPD